MQSERLNLSRETHTPIKPTYFLDGAMLSTPSVHYREEKMATFRKLKSVRWQIIVRKPGDCLLFYETGVYKAATNSQDWYILRFLYQNQ